MHITFPRKYNNVKGLKEYVTCMGLESYLTLRGKASVRVRKSSVVLATVNGRGEHLVEEMEIHRADDSEQITAHVRVGEREERKKGVRHRSCTDAWFGPPSPIYIYHCQVYEITRATVRATGAVTPCFHLPSQRPRKSSRRTANYTCGYGHAVANPTMHHRRSYG